MKKNVGIISLDSAFTKWLHEKIRTSAPDTPGAKELLEGIDDLMNGKADSLMLELGGMETRFSVNNEICCGILSIYPSTEKYLQRSRFIRLCGKANIY